MAALIAGLLLGSPRFRGFLDLLRQFGGASTRARRPLWEPHHRVRRTPFSPFEPGRQFLVAISCCGHGRGGLDGRVTARRKCFSGVFEALASLLLTGGEVIEPEVRRPCAFNLGLRQL